ncbi:T6SS effector BTH_I2691 family protein [Klebsiella aerogenes]
MAFVIDRNNCPMCQVKGPALIPARYAVVTDNIAGGIPSWAVNPKTAKSYKPVPGYNYALRAMRQGFIYVFYEKSRQWDAWAVCEDGSLWKQPSGAYAQPKKTPDCTSPKHQATNLEMMILDEKALKGNTWLAFSPSKWMHETLDRYASDVGLRQERMQCLASSEWTTPNQQGATAASPGSLENILDYQELRNHASSLLPYNPAIRRISQTEPKAPWYNFEESDVKPQGTLYPWSKNRIGGASRTMQALKNRHEGKNKYGKDITPLVMAIEDPVGIAHELAGFGDDFAALHKAWMDDLSIEFATEQNLIGAESQIKLMKSQYAKGKAKFDTEQFREMTRYDNIQVNTDELQSNIEGIYNNARYAQEWSDYTPFINQEKRAAFTACNEAFCAEISRKLDILSTLRITWLGNHQFIACTQDFYSLRPEDNISYAEIVEYAIASLNLTQTGTAWLDAQIDAYSAQEESNLVWRLLMLNNKDVIAETQPFMQALVKYKGNTQKADADTFLTNTLALSGKFAKAYEKANAIIVKNPTPTSSWGEKMLRADRKMTTLGDRFFNFARLGKRLDTLTEVLHKQMFLVISGVPFNNAVGINLSQIEFGDAFRQEALNKAIRETSDTRVDKLNAYRENYEKLSKSSEYSRVLRSGSLQILILIFNGLEFKNQINALDKEPGNAKVLAKVIATGASTFSVASKLVEPVIEHALKNEGALNTIKEMGARASSVAAVLFLGIDTVAFKEEFYGHARWQFIGLYGVKTGVDGFILIKSVGGLMELLVNRNAIANQILNGMAKGVANLAKKELVGFFASWQVMIGLYLLERIIVLYFTDELKDWVKSCVFGVKAKSMLCTTEFIGASAIRKQILEKENDDFATALADLR